MGQGHVQPEAGHQHDQPLGHRHRLGVGGGVGPGDRDLAPAQVLTEDLPDGHQVRQGLAGMVDVALHVDHRLLRPLGDLPHIGIALPRHQVVAHRNAVTVGGEDDPGVLGTLAMGDLRGGGIDKMGMPAQLGDPGLERISGAGRLVEEQQENSLVGQETVGNAAAEHLFQLGRLIQQHLQLRIGPILGGNIIFALQRSVHRDSP